LTEKARSIAGGHYFGRSLARAIGIMPAEGIYLPVREHPAPILVDFIGGDDYDRSHRCCFACGIEYVRCSHHVGGESLHGPPIALPNQRLRGKMEHYLWLCCREGSTEASQGCQVRPVIGRQQRLDARRFEEARTRRRVERKAVNASIQLLQPHCQP